MFGGGAERVARVCRGALASVATMGTTVRGRLLLMAATEEVPVEGVIVAAFAQPYRKPIEHAGKPYQERLARQRSGLYHGEENGHAPEGSSASSTDEGDDGTADGDEDEETPAWQLKKLTARNSDDLYELLELGDKRWHATEDDIKKAFRRLSLKYHPDKIAHAGEEAMEDAGSTLSPCARRLTRCRTAENGRRMTRLMRWTIAFRLRRRRAAPAPSLTL